MSNLDYKTGHPKCPICKNYVEIYYCSDEWYGDEAEVVTEMYGGCPKCKKYYKWEEIYAAVGYRELDERTEYDWEED